MKKTFLIIPALCLMSLIPLAACVQNHSKNMRQPNVEKIREQAPTPETDDDACPDCPDDPNCSPDDPNCSPDTPESTDAEKAPDNEFLKDLPKIKPPVFGGRMKFDDKMPKIGAFGFMLIMPSPDKSHQPETPEVPETPETPEVSSED